MKSHALALKLGVSVATVYSWRSGRCKPHFLMVAAIAKAMGTTKRKVQVWLDTKIT